MAIIPTTTDQNVERDAEIRGRVIKIIDRFTSAADNKYEGFVSSRGNEIVVDTWQSRWGAINDAAHAVDRLATIFEDAGFAFRVKDQPTGPARNREGVGLGWDNMPELSVTMPSRGEAESALLRLETVAEMTAKYRPAPRKFTMRAL